MKKTYEKPMVMYEKFELSQNIAVCAWDVKTSKTPHECGAIGDADLNMPDIRIFTEGSLVCEYSDKEWEALEGEGEKFCYTVSSDNWTIFNS